jgi:hypothetical protein
MTLLGPTTIVDDFSLTPRNPLGLTSDGQATWVNILGTWAVDSQTLPGVPTQNYARGFNVEVRTPNPATTYYIQSRSETRLALPDYPAFIIKLNGYLKTSYFNNTYQLFQLLFAYTDESNYALWQFENLPFPYNGVGLHCYYVVAGIQTGYASPNLNQFKSIAGSGQQIFAPLNIINLNTADELNAMPTEVQLALTGKSIGFVDFFTGQTTNTADSKFAFLSKLTVQGISLVSKGYQHMWANNPDQRAGMYNVNTNTADRGNLWNNLRS